MAARPNILLIMADQWRPDYLGCAGADFIRTPHLDRLAASGTRFSQCTTNAPVCAPARIALASGLQPTRLGAVGNNCFLPRSTPTYYQRLRDDGYQVSCFGKLDLAKPANYNGRHGDRPCAFTWGFTHPLECEGKMHAGSSPTPLGPYGFHLQEQGLYQPFYEDYRRRAREGFHLSCHDSVLPTAAFEDAFIGRRAAEWLATAPDDFPWHCFVSFVGPHDPFDPPTEYADRYRDSAMPTAIPISLDGKPRYVAGRTRQHAPEKVLATRRQYCAAIELIDNYVGEMLAALSARGQLAQTVVIFTSDHGEMLGDHGLYTKSVPYEASMRVPLIVAGPDLPAAADSDALIELIDLNPTICEVAGLAPQADIDARSFVAAMREGCPHRQDSVTALQAFRCLRTARYKWIENTADAPELYDLENDPDEQHNIAADRPALAKELSARLHARYLEGQWRR